MPRGRAHGGLRAEPGSHVEHPGFAYGSRCSYVRGGCCPPPGACCGTLDSNAFKVDAGGGLRALYALASMINHDCAPNSRITFDSRRRLHLLAKRDIHKGEEITVTYCNPLLGTPARQEALRRNRFFLCTCRRCADPTEFGKDN